MAAKLPNTTSTIVTRYKKKRDLESTMNTLKKLLEPTIFKKGSRKKNKPRSLPKKKVATKTIKRLEDSEDDAEFYPNKLKRKVQMKKIELKPNSKMKVVVATNKRKRGTPHKGLDYIEPPTIPSLDLKVLTPTLTPDITKYDLISPPHKSLTELTVDDLMRMDEDSLSDENLMEILTCPSPVWWEDPPDQFTGTLFLINTVKTTDEHNHNENNSKNATNLKRTGATNDLHGKDKKFAKLESVLGNIKSRVLSDNRSAGFNEDNASNNSNKPDIDVNLVSNVQDITKDGKKAEGTDVSKRRALSSSGSDDSVNEDDLLRNLESIDIPIQTPDNGNNVRTASDAIINRNEVKDEKKESNKNIPNNASNEVKNVETGDSVDIKSNIWFKTTNSNQKSLLRTDNVPENNEINVKKNNLYKPTKKKSLLKKTSLLKNKNEDAIDKSVLERLKPLTDDILDVRLIQTPTNISNEVKIWSHLDNFKRHNFKPEDFDKMPEVITVEDEFNSKNNEIKTSDPIDTNDETILIDDDSNDATDVNKETYSENIIDLNVIEGEDVNLNTGLCNTNEIDTELINDKDIINVDTIEIGNTLSVRLIETKDKPIQAKPKPRIPIAKIFQKPLKDYTRNRVKSNDVREIRILPKEALEKVRKTYPTRFSESNPKRYTENTPIKIQELNIDEQKKNDSVKEINTNTCKDKIVRINDLEVSLVTSDPVKSKIHDNYKIAKTTENLKNDLSITLVNKSEVKGVNFSTVSTTVPLKLPTLIKNPKKFESPKSVNSFASEYSEGTISDTNIHYLDEYEGTQDVGEYIDECNVSDVEEVENIATEEIAEIKLINIEQNVNKNDILNKEPAIEEEYLEFDINDQETNRHVIENDVNLNNTDKEKTLTEDDIIEEEYLDGDKEYLEYSEMTGDNDKNIDLTFDNDDQILVEDDRSAEDNDEIKLDFNEDIDQNKNIDEDMILNGCDENTNDLVTVYQIVEKS